MKDQRIPAIPFIPVIITLWLLAVSCQSAGSYDRAEPGVRFRISCEDGRAIRHHYASATGELVERGPVALRKGMSCDDAEDLDEKAMLRLQREGQWTGYYKGTLNPLWKGLFKKNKREGVLTYFDRKGNKTKIITYSGGSKEGLEEGYFSSGAIRYRGQNSNNMKTGLWQSWGSEDSACITKGMYSKGEKTGQWEECALNEETGKWYLAFRGNYVQGLRDGPVEIFHPTGELLGKGSYRADLICKSKPPAEGVEACSKRTGKWTLYHPSGKLAAEGEYDGATGKKRGTWTEYYASGQKMAMGPRDHTRNGIWTFYSKDGQIIGQFGFKGNDAMPRYCIVYEKGVKKEEGPCMGVLVKYVSETDEIKLAGRIRQTDAWKGYHANGTKAWEGMYVNGLKMGAWKFYSEQGKLIGQGNFRMNKKVGRWKEMKNGRLVEVEYDDFGRLKN